MPVKSSFADFLERIVPFIQEEMLEKNRLHDIRRLSYRLPYLTLGCFECFLGDGQDRVDLNVSISAQLKEYELVSATLDPTIVRAGLLEEDSLENIKAFCTHWCRRNFPLTPFLGDLWLVFDFISLVPKKVVQWHYIGFINTPINKHPPFKTELLFQVLKYLEEQFGTERAHLLRNFLNAIPPALFVNAIGIQKARAVDYLRLYLVTNTFEEILIFLGANHWQGDTEDLRNKTKPLARRCSFFGLTMDIGEKLLPKIGLEFWPDNNGSENNYKILTDHLVAMGLCTHVQQSYLTGWSGEEVDVVDSSADLVHDNPGMEITLSEKAIIKRSAPYLKIVYQPGSSMAAKGYLFFERKLEGDKVLRINGSI